MHQVPREDQLELAEAIAAGVRRRPRQAFGEYFSETGGSCALGAAYEGAYALPRDAQSVRPRLDRLFDCLENVVGNVLGVIPVRIEPCLEFFDLAMKLHV